MKDKCEMSLNKSNRVIWIDVVKFICIMCVVLSHTETCTGSLEVIFNPFFLSAFFFCSGYVHKQIDFLTFLKKKTVQLLVPWFVFSMLHIFLLYIVNGRTVEYANEHGSILEHIGWNLLQIRGIDDGMWFVAALFVAYIPFYFIIKKYNSNIVVNKSKLVLIIVGFALAMLSSIYALVVKPEMLPYNAIGLPWHMEYIFYAMFFMILGYLFKGEYEHIFDKYNTKKNRIIITLIYLVVIYTIFLLDFTGGIVGKIITEYIVVVLSIAVVVAWCKVVKKNKYVMFIGRNTLIYFGLHTFVYRLLEKIMYRMVWYHNVLSYELLSIVVSIVLTVVVSIILIIPTIIIERYFPWMIGRKNK